MPSPVQYPVHQAPNSISVMLIEEAPAPKVEEVLPEEKISELQELVEARTPVAPPEEKKESQQESQHSLGAQVEATPLEFVNQAPAYPAIARRRGWEGVVIVQVRVEKDGHPSSVTVAQTSGYQMLDQAAVDTIRDWRFKPAKSGPLSFASTINIPVRFQLVEEE